ncbi:hypothetical protein SSUA7_1919 [Streptococcus suis A7]|uniref:Uncharacterized protein n=1 Tax=Streptococcus suis (strain GZ1) TaxID=423211 RepID=D5AEX5_STRGZ|nr:hypothetical protein SSGZ1_1912 [Streptococcus suis GZ1]AER45235.1 hypothetical protein SSUA7_1919 [Streptococcus suis A7]
MNKQSLCRDSPRNCFSLTLEIKSEVKKLDIGFVKKITAIRIL